MKLVKSSFIILILLTSIAVCFGQEKSEALLIDKFGNLTCGDIMARTDILLHELFEDPNSQGYVIIYPEKNSAKKALRLERIINASIYMRRFDKNRIIVIRSKENNYKEATVEFWKVPFDAEKPFFVEEEWVDSATALTKPFIFGSIWNDDACPLFIAEKYANLIKDKPNLRGHIVVFNPSKKEARNDMKEWLKLFTEEYKVPRDRLKIFFGKNNDIPDLVEFWIVPQK